MKKFAALLVASAAATALSATSARAQTTACPDGITASVPACVHTHTLSTTVNDILLLTVSSNATGLGNPTSTNYAPLASIGDATPLAAVASPNVKVVANKAYQVSIAAATTNFSTAPATVAKPASDVQWNRADLPATSFAGLLTAGALFMSGIGTADTNYGLLFRSRWAFERDVPGTYTLQVTLTLAAN